MRLTPETLAAHRQRHQRERSYPPHTLAPDPHQSELDLRPMPKAERRDIPFQWTGCPLCGRPHPTIESTNACKGRNTHV